MLEFLKVGETLDSPPHCLVDFPSFLLTLIYRYLQLVLLFLTLTLMLLKLKIPLEEGPGLQQTVGSILVGFSWDE
jgi:hypothetical protein